jgi:hypothetical protein
MSDDKRNELARYRLEKAKEDYRASSELLKLSLYKQSLNRYIMPSFMRFDRSWP